MEEEDLSELEEIDEAGSVPCGAFGPLFRERDNINFNSTVSTAAHFPSKIS